MLLDLLVDLLTRFLSLTTVHRTEPFFVIPYVALSLGIARGRGCLGLEPGVVMAVAFEFSIYNHSDRAYYGCKGSFVKFIFLHTSIHHVPSG